ncbi:MAG: hypothetical protein JWR15_3496 [Prosthecobacter sp.]|nr:hypothetical protein [Prosthecobacter sp.]
MEIAPFFAMASLFTLVFRLYFKSLEQLGQLEKLTNDDWMALTAVVCITIALFISHKMHEVTGR